MLIAPLKPKSIKVFNENNISFKESSINLQKPAEKEKKNRHKEVTLNSVCLGESEVGSLALKRRLQLLGRDQRSAPLFIDFMLSILSKHACFAKDASYWVSGIRSGSRSSITKNFTFLSLFFFSISFILSAWKLFCGRDTSFKPMRRGSPCDSPQYIDPSMMISYTRYETCVKSTRNTR